MDTRLIDYNFNLDKTHITAMPKVEENNQNNKQIFEQISRIEKSYDILSKTTYKHNQELIGNPYFKFTNNLLSNTAEKQIQ